MFDRMIAARSIPLLVLVTVLSGKGVLAQDGIDSMHLIGRNDAEFAHVMDIHIAGDYAYASVGLGAGLQTYDISDPTDPIRVNTQSSPGWRAYARGDTIFNFLHSCNGLRSISVKSFDFRSMVSSSFNEVSGDRLTELIFMSFRFSSVS